MTEPADLTNRRTQVPPHDAGAEHAVVGAILLQADSLDTCLGLLQPDDFYMSPYKNIYNAMLYLRTQDQPIDEVTVASRLQETGLLHKIGGSAFIASISETVPTAANIDYYAQIVQGHGLRRRVIRSAIEISSLACDQSSDIRDLAHHVESRIYAATNSVHTQTAFSTARELVARSVKDVERRFNDKRPIIGLATGFSHIDSMTAGLQAGDLIVIAGRPSMGKTALALNIAQHIGVSQRIPVCFFSLEMSAEALMDRLLCAEAGIDSQRFRRGQLHNAEWNNLDSSAERISASPIYIDESGGLSITDMRARARRLSGKCKLGIVIVDYLQLVRGTVRTERREQEIAEIARGLKNMAKELGIPVIALSQLNRSVEQREDKRPLLSDLRESGAIEQDADLIAMLYRDDYYNKDSSDVGMAEVLISKQRKGPTGVVRLRFASELTRFEDEQT